MLQACLDVDPVPGQVAAVRAFVRSTLSDWDLLALEADTVLVASELATNAVVHARTAFRVTLTTSGDSSVRIEVRDDSRRLPVERVAGDDATSGRGMNLISALAEEWGALTVDDRKVVWAQVGAHHA